MDRDEFEGLEELVDVVDDDQLRLMFLCCHPALSPDAQVALALRLLGGLEVPDIARGFVTGEATIAQRIVRAKRKLRDNRAPYRIPRAADLPGRLESVLATIHLVFNEGHTATSGDDLVRVDLVAEAIRLGRVLVALMPDEPEAVGLLALMLLSDARRTARTGTAGELIRLSEQDRRLWNRELIAEGHELVRWCLRRGAPGRYQLQAAIAAVHADAAGYERTDWAQIVALHDHLATLMPGPTVAINRAVAVAELSGAAAGLVALHALGAEGLAAVEENVSFHATIADLRARTGDVAGSISAYDRAIELGTNVVETAFLRRQRDAVSSR